MKEDCTYCSRMSSVDSDVFPREHFIRRQTRSRADTWMYQPAFACQHIAGRPGAAPFLGKPKEKERTEVVVGGRNDFGSHSALDPPPPAFSHSPCGVFSLPHGPPFSTPPKCNVLVRACTSAIIVQDSYYLR